MGLTQITTGGVDDNINIDSNTLKVDGTNNRVGIGTASPAAKLEIGNVVQSGSEEVLTIDRADGTQLYSIGWDTTGNEVSFSGNTKNFVFKNGSSSSETMRIDSSGRVSIKNTVASTIGAVTNAADLVIGDGTNAAGITIYTGTGNSGELAFADGTAGSNTQRGRIIYAHGDNSMRISTNAGEAMRIDSSGNVGIGTTSASTDISASAQGLSVAHSNVAFLSVENTSASGKRYTLYTNDAGALVTYDEDDNAERMRIASDGKATFNGTVQCGGDPNSGGAVGVKMTATGIFQASRSSGASAVFTGYTQGTTAATSRINADGTATFTSGITANWGNFTRDTTNSSLTFLYGGGGGGITLASKGSGVYLGTSLSNINNTTPTGTNSVLYSNGNASFNGSVSKGSGSFRIDHPLKPETHHLVHSFVESPQADNIYRGKVDLVDGAASVNIDTVADMTEGTFVALNREIQCFTTNETGWTAIKGSVLNNILTIEAQDSTCTDTISWLVIGERQDQHMYDTEWTDENGKVIVEPEKIEVAALEAG